MKGSSYPEGKRSKEGGTLECGSPPWVKARSSPLDHLLQLVLFVLFPLPFTFPLPLPHHSLHRIWEGILYLTNVSESNVERWSGRSRPDMAFR